MNDASPPAPGDPAAHLSSTLSDLGRRLGERERQHLAGLDAARRRAEALHALVSRGIEAFHAAVDAAGAPQLRVELSAPRPDDKHARAVQFALQRGRHTAVITVKSRGEVTLVGPFKTGKVEGPCLSFPLDAEDDLHRALADFLSRFLEEAATP
jgi:hypothetical protein